MIIQLRGLSGSGKSTIVRQVLTHYVAAPIYGALGMNKPEAYRCWGGPLKGLSRDRDKFPLHILGPYGISHEGVDWLTKRMSFAQFMDFLSLYAAKGDVLFESLRFSTRWAAPTMGNWLTRNRDRCILAVLEVPYEQVRADIAQRQRDLGRGVKEQKHAQAERKLFENATGYAERAGMRIERVTRENAVSKILGWLS